MKFNHTEAIVLTGGRGARMGGLDKGLLKLCGKPLVQWVTDSISPQVDGVILSANRNLEEYKKLGFPVVVDEFGDFQGPLAGIHAALKKVNSEFVLVVPTDSPKLPPDLCYKLGRALERSGADIAVVEFGGHIQPVLMLFRSELKPDIERTLKHGLRKVLDWITSQRYTTVSFSGDELLSVNINDQDSLAAASEKLCL